MLSELDATKGKSVKVHREHYNGKRFLTSFENIGILGTSHNRKMLTVYASGQAVTSIGKQWIGNKYTWKYTTSQTHGTRYFHKIPPSHPIKHTNSLL